MTSELGQWILALDGADSPDRQLIGGKAWSIARMRSLGLRVPPAFVVTTRACTEFLREGRPPEHLGADLAAGINWLETQSGRRFGSGPRPLLVSVRSGAPVSMPGMMDTVLNLGIDAITERALAAEWRSSEFARDTRRRFLDLYSNIVMKAPTVDLAAGAEPEEWEMQIERAAGEVFPKNVFLQLHNAVVAVFESWNSRRAIRYREHHKISHQLGTAVTVQTMVFGNLDGRSGTGVLFSRNPSSGQNEPFGEFLLSAQGEDLVSGKQTPQPISVLRSAVPEAFDELLAAGRLLEKESGDVQDIEFTVERGQLFLLQSRPAKRSPQAAVRIAVDAVREGEISIETALRRVVPEQVRSLLAPRLAPEAATRANVLATGIGASPGVGRGRVVSDPDEAERRGHGGDDIVLGRATTSPNDLHAMLYARAIITEQGGSTSHAAVVGRSLGIPCVVGCGASVLSKIVGRLVTVDGQAGRIYEGLLEVVVPNENDDEWLSQVLIWAQQYSPIRVFDSAPVDALAFDLSKVAGSEDETRIGTVLSELKCSVGLRGARGGVIATEAGIRAALAAGLEFIVASPRLPALLTAIHSTDSGCGDK